MGNKKKNDGGPLSKDFIRLLTDFGFKRVFGSKEHSEILRRFLNALFEGEMYIETITFQDKELQPEHVDGKKIQYDIYCTTSQNEHFIVEMQQEETENFPERILFYVSKAIVNQGLKGVSYEIDPVYCIVLTDFDLSEMSKSLLKDIVFMDRYTQEVYTNKARIIFLSLRQVPRQWEKCNTELLRLLWLIKNMEKLTKRSKPYLSGEYDDLFTAAATGNLTNEEAIAYSASYYKELERESALRFAVKKAEVKAEARGEARGEAKGEMKKNLENARNFKLLGVDPAIIAKGTGLSIEEIERL